MSQPNRTDAVAELNRFEDSLVDSIMNASETDLLEEIDAAGEDPAVIVRGIDCLFVSAKNSCARQRLRMAQEELRAFRSRLTQTSPTERKMAQHKFEAARLHDQELSSKLLLAARNGRDPTERDVESLIDDIAELERLIGEAGDDHNESG